MADMVMSLCALVGEYFSITAGLGRLSASISGECNHLLKESA
jgi:hypothetical protein